MTAICHRCAAEKAEPLDVCSACATAPTGEDRALALLFSARWLDPAELDEAALRLRAGERPAPSPALRRAVLIRVDGGQPLPARQLGLLIGGSLLLSPLLALACYLGWQEERPGAASQALRVALFLGAAEGAAWLAWVGAGL